jgi:hypothetical protein
MNHRSILALQFVFVILLAACSVSPVHLGAKVNASNMVIRCMIFDAHRELVANFSDGYICIFLPDGTYISSDGTKLRRVGQLGETLWSKKLHVHHIMTLAHNSNILVLTSKTMTFNKERVRADQLLIFDNNGNVLSRYDLGKNIATLAAKAERPARVISSKWAKPAYVESENEVTHANSIYEIPENESAKFNHAFDAGNIIVNTTDPGVIFILDPHLKKILWAMGMPSRASYGLHDVQVLPNGNLLAYNNHGFPFGKKLCSELDEYDPINKVLVWVYHSTPEDRFCSEYSGGVQVLDSGNVVYSDITRGGQVFEIDRSGKEVWHFDFPKKDAQTNRPEEIQDAKIQDLSSFLKMHRGF